jgi:tripartite-type tricarboxylate transporter receptor subunit TctC
MPTRVRVAALAAIAAALTPAASYAQDYPARPIRVIAASSPGGLSDVFMRAVGEQLQKRIGQPLVIENRAGGAFNIGAKACAEAAPDGYTICILPNEPVTYNLFLVRNIGFDPDKGLHPITNLFFIIQSLAVNSSLNAGSLTDLAALSKAKPGTLSYSSPGYAQALFVEKFKQETGADLVRVPFKGGGDAITGMLTGTTPAVFIGLGNVISHIRAGTVRALLVDSEKRAGLVPETPTISESGYRGDMTRSYFGLFAPAGTPDAIATKLRDEIARIVEEPSFKDRHIVERGLEPVMNSSAEFASYIRQDRAAAERVVKASGLEAQ